MSAPARSPSSHRTAGSSRLTYQPRNRPSGVKNHHTEWAAPGGVSFSTPGPCQVVTSSRYRRVTHSAKGIARISRPSSAIS